MVEAKEFLKYICENLEYRFFAGVPSKGLKSVYDSMDSDIMHYIPAVDGKTAFSLVAGAFVSGYKGIVLVDSCEVPEIEFYYKKLSSDIDINMLVISYGEVDTDFKKFYLDGKLEGLDDITDEIYLYNSGPCILVVKEGDLSE